MPKTVTLRLSDESYEALYRAATSESRTLANLIETSALAHLREAEFVDDFEMAAIKADAELVKRLKAGSAAARNRRGRFVQ